MKSFFSFTIVLSLTLPSCILHAQVEQDYPRLRVVVGFGFGSANATSDYKTVWENQRLWVTEESGLFSSRQSSGSGSGMFARADYTFYDRFSIGAAITSLGRVIGSGAIVGGSYHYYFPVYYSIAATMRQTAIGTYGVIGCCVIRPSEQRPLELRCGIGAGTQRIEVGYGATTAYWWSNTTSEARSIQIQFSHSKRLFSALAFIDANVRFTGIVTIGANVSYSFIPVQTIEAMRLHAGYYIDRTTTPEITREAFVDVPRHEANFGYFLFSVVMGVRF